MQALLRGELDRSAYRSLLSNLLAIYSTLEPALGRHATHPALAAVFSEDLFRSTALRADLAAIVGDDEALTPATLAYVERLIELDTSDPELLLAHSYVRYLGDLNGGQILGPIVSRSAAMQGSRAVSFYDFGDVSQTATLLSAYRAGLASIVLAPARADAVVAEAKWSFAQHVAMFIELANSRTSP
jgi:heme oxygenase